MMLKEMSLYSEIPNLWVKAPVLSVDAGADKEEG